MDTERSFTLLILCSPSGAGKTTLAHAVQKLEPKLDFSVSHTTRAPRSGEVDGRDYYFNSRADMLARIERGEFAEWAWVHGNLYGTSHQEIRRCRAQGASGVIFDIDVQGARQLRALYPSEALSVFVLPPSAAILRARLEGRGSEDEASLKRRLGVAAAELGHYQSFDYVLVNDHVDEAAATLHALVIAGRHQQNRMRMRAEALLDELRTLQQDG